MNISEIRWPIATKFDLMHYWAAIIFGPDATRTLVSMAIDSSQRVINGGKRCLTYPDSLVVRASASRAVGRGFAPRSRHTKGVKNGTSSSLAESRM